MVGSGFSRNALNVRPGTNPIPLWPEVAYEIYSRLYPECGEIDRQKEISTTIATDRILSLAQEYKTAFERANISFFSRLTSNLGKCIPECCSFLGVISSQRTGTPYWSGRGPQVKSISYSIVRDMDEIPLAKRPRIVKLHGSFPAQFPLIITEEDYRTCPTKFSPFVNTVQQAMMETVFCLIGFSGNDPNFLSWSGWVRDNLGDSAPRIYLVTVR